MARRRRPQVVFTDNRGRPVQVPADLLDLGASAWRSAAAASRWLTVQGIEGQVEDVMLDGHPLGLPSQRVVHRRTMAARCWAEDAGLDWRTLGDRGIEPFVRPWSRPGRAAAGGR